MPAHRCAVKRNGNVEIMDETPHGLVEQDLDQFGGAVVLSDPSKIDVNCVSVGTSLGDVNRMIGQLQRDRRSLPKKQLERIAEFRRKIELHGPIGHRNDQLCASSKKLRRSSAPNEIPDVAVIAASRDSAAANHRYGSPDVPGAAVVVVVVLVVVVVVAGDAAACAGTTMASTTGRVQVFGNNATVAPAPGWRR